MGMSGVPESPSLRYSTFTTSSPSGGFYDKIGAYATSTGNGPVTVQWSNLQFFHQ